MKHSMTARLVALYTVSACFTLLAFALLSMWALQKNVNLDEAELLDRYLTIVGDLLDDIDRNRELLSAAINPDRAGSHRVIEPLYLRVRDEQRNTLFETDGMSAELPIDAFPDCASSAPKRYVTAKGRSYLLASDFEQNPRGGANGARLCIEAATSLKNDDRLLAQIRRDMIFLLVCGVVLLTVGGYLSARRGLQPLRAIVHDVSRVRADRLNMRLARERRPTELADLALAFDEMLDRLEESFERLKEFSANLAHELRTPVNTVLGQTEVALLKPRSGDDYRRLLSSNLEELSRLARLIDTLLFLARADSTQISIERRTFEVERELESVMNFFEALAQEKGVVMRRDGGGVVSAEPTLFRRAVSNLVSNALRHTAAGQQVRLVATQEPGNGMTVEVIDEGTGITAESLPHVFERFYRGPEEPREEGMGLGLAIVQSIMTLHGGTVELHGVWPHGTRAVLRFPGLAITKR